MERTVPTTESEEVELYLRTYYSLLRSTAQVQIRTLEEAHAGMNSLLHPLARESQPDMSAFIYSLLRLPPVMAHVELVVLGQSADVFCRAGFGDVYHWQRVSAPARRRRTFFNEKGTLACFIASRSDIDDLIPLLTAYQIEWNKLHHNLRRISPSTLEDALSSSLSGSSRLAEMLGITTDDLERLAAIWVDDFVENLKEIARRPQRLKVQLLNGSLSEYRRATHAWWHNIQDAAPFLSERPVYFVSSNTHSLLNLLSGFPLMQEEDLVSYLQTSGNAGLLNEWKDIQTGRIPTSRENFLYYVYKKYLQTGDQSHLAQKQLAWETQHGLMRIPSKWTFEVEAQVYELNRLNPDKIDPRLQDHDLSFLSNSDAVVLNIDYPLGMAAYNILSEVAETVGSVQAVYVMGKAASLNAVVGDVMAPNVVHDEHSQNTYLFSNCFSAADVAPYLVYGTMLDNQKAVTVQGTFLQNARYMDVFYREGYTDIEMESGPFLSAIYEMHRPTRHPVNEIVNLYGIPFDLGILHYASDTPLSKGRNLGAGSLSYYGMDSTYAASIAVLQRIFHQERKRLKV